MLRTVRKFWITIITIGVVSLLGSSAFAAQNARPVDDHQISQTNSYIMARPSRYSVETAPSVRSRLAVRRMPQTSRTLTARSITRYGLQGFTPARRQYFGAHSQMAQARSGGNNGSGRVISASQAKAIALAFSGGAKFINVQLINPTTYRIRLQQKNGRIVDVYVDVNTGQVRT